VARNLRDARRACWTMASIGKLSVQGVRSFDPGAAQVIAFDKPLTVILGPNGSGKTVRLGLLPMHARIATALTQQDTDNHRVSAVRDHGRDAARDPVHLHPQPSRTGHASPAWPRVAAGALMRGAAHWQVAGVASVRGQVRLQFTNLAGRQVTCTRNVEVSVRADKGLTAKTIDSSLQITTATGEV
jgi:hypothetical protein